MTARSAAAAYAACPTSVLFLAGSTSVSLDAPRPASGCAACPQRGRLDLGRAPQENG